MMRSIQVLSRHLGLGHLNIILVYLLFVLSLITFETTFCTRDTFKVLNLPPTILITEWEDKSPKFVKKYFG